eukprot:CAMPEP_0172787966 /NCGR_PEP_ID=MMETSP1074-20121228/206711_1 /TAXON_ID=2916 /ORGANISM="Ceratium fusus, Strain PA161109" /LENGTH=1772 /DNA_ID=CAMNT_0013624987 /DNA_START=12 /DNA_END=5330 /DNA_ORIENTATION=-
MSSAAATTVAGVPAVTIQEAARAAAARGRSASPGQYGSQGYGAKSPPAVPASRAGSHGQRGVAGAQYPMAASPTEPGVPSPRTPRQGYVGGVGGDYRINIIVAEMQRQVESDRRAVHRQLEQLDRRLHDVVAAPSVGRERWADLQGSVSGLLEEMSALARRVEGLEEKLLLRTSNCEELTRQRTRELEQLLQAQQHKSLLTASTSEEMSKRHTARLRKMGQAVDDQARRLQALEDAARKPSADSEAVRLEARMADLEGQHSSVAEELRGLMMSSVRVCSGQHGDTTHHSGSGEDLEAAVRTLERGLDALTRRSSGQLDDHAAALASLRIRTEGQEQRLSAAAERLENVVAPPLEALRAEVTQSREHDRQEAKSQIEHLTRQLQVLAEANEEATCELRDGLKELQTEVSAHGPVMQEHPAIRGLLENTATQEKAIRKLEQMVAEAAPHDKGMPAEEFRGYFGRVDTLEQRLECLEHTYGEEEFREKADRAELLRLDAALQELSEPLQRLSQRTARGEARAAALERRLEQLQQVSHSPQLQSRDSVDQSRELSHRGNASGIQVDVGTIADLMARVVDLEALLEADGIRTSSATQDLRRLNALRNSSEDLVGRRIHDSAQETGLAVSVQKLRKDVAEFQGNTQEHIANALERVSCGEEITRVLRSDLQRLQGEFGEMLSAKQCHLAGAGQISELLGRIDGHEERTRALNVQLEQLRSDHQELAHAKLESDDLGNRVSEEVQRIVTNEDTVVALSGHLEPSIRSVEAQLEQLRKEHGDLVEAKSNSDGDARNRLSSALLRVSSSEQKVTALQEKLEPPLMAIENRLDQLQEKLEAERDAPRPSLALDTELPARIAAALERISAGEEKVNALQQKLEPPIRALETGLEQFRTDQAKQTERKALDEELSARVLAAARRSADEEIVALREQLQPALGELKASLQELRNDHEELGRHEALTRDVHGRITEATQRMLAGEETMKAIQEQLATTPPRDLEAQLQQHRNDHEVMRSHSVFSEDLPKRISEAVDHTHAVELRLTSVQEQLEVSLKSLEVQLQQLQSDHEALSGHDTFKVQLKQLQEDHEALAGHEVFEESLKSLNLHFVELKGHEVFHADLPSRIEEVSQRLSNNEKALASLETKDSQEPARGEDSSEELTQKLEGLRVELAGTQSSVRVLSAKIEEVSAQAEANAVSNKFTHGHEAQEAPPMASSGMECQIRELQTQMAQELDVLARQRLELTELGSRSGLLGQGTSGGEASVDKEMEDAVEQLSKQVLAELHDLRDHQQELGKLRTAVSSSAAKDQNEDLTHSKGGGRNDDGQRISTVLDRITASDEKVAALQKVMEAPIRALELQLRQMQNERGPGDRRNLDMELASSMAEVMHRSTENEEANMVLQKQLKELRNANREAAQGTESAIKLLAGKVEQMMQKTSLEANGTDSLGQVQKLAKTGSLGPEQSPRTTQSTQMELHIRELQQQVRRELECLARHQRELMESRPAAEQGFASSMNGVAVAGSSGVKAQMEALSEQVATELRSFAEQQAELGQARVTVEGLGQQLNDLQQQFKDLRDHSTGNPSKESEQEVQLGERVSEVPQRTSRGEDMETRVRDLHEQVARELASLTHYQQELEHARPSLAGGEIKQAVKQLSEQVLMELRELQDHQHELGKFRAVMVGLPEKAESASGHDELPRIEAKAESASGHDELPRIEAKVCPRVQEVSKQVSDELQALADQQQDLGKAHETIYGMVTQLEEGFGRIADCQRAHVDLRQRLEELRPAASSS